MGGYNFEVEKLAFNVHQKPSMRNLFGLRLITWL